VSDRSASPDAQASSGSRGPGALRGDDAPGAGEAFDSELIETDPDGAQEPREEPATDVADVDAGAPAHAAEPEAAEAPAEPRWSTRDRTRERELIALIAELPEGDPRYAAARDELVTMHLPLAAFLARRFRDRGESLDDLTQVATIGLIKAVDRFDPQRGVEFSTFATPTIVGEIKRHFRDKGWAIRVPRRLQELRISIGRATAELSQSTGRSPTVAELAAHLDVSDEEILEGLESAQAYATLSLDASSADAADEGGSSLADTLGEDDPGLGEVETRETLHPLVATLPAREQRILHMRFYDNMTQAQIAEQIGVSQMHVSRLLAKSLAQLRSGLVEPTS
jgi:RNA polymerase sigma-B factor